MQGEIANIMGISRATVNGYLQMPVIEASSISRLNLYASVPLQLHRNSKHHFGLSDCLVVPNDDGAHPLTRPASGRLVHRRSPGF
ncbi:hypothetical protein VXQ18_03275 [Brucella abortus]|nr:hypothetical protein [Brucella abortus]